MGGFRNRTATIKPALEKPTAQFEGAVFLVPNRQRFSMLKNLYYKIAYPAVQNERKARRKP